MNLLPQPLRHHPHWLVSNNKAPVIPTTNDLIRGNRLEQTISFDEAAGYLNAGIHHQAGILHTQESPLVSVDMDKVIVDDQPVPEVVPFLEKMKALGAYIELSTSGSGLRIPTWNQSGSPLEWSKQIFELTNRTDKERPKIELYNNNQYVIYTGNLYHPGSVVPDFATVLAILVDLYPQPEPEKPTPRPQPMTTPHLGNGGWQRRWIEQALPCINPDCTREEWLLVGMALHDHFQGSNEGLAIWDQWSAGGAKYCETKGDQPEKKWKGFRGGKGTTLGTLFQMAEQNGWVKPEPVRELVPPAGEPSFLPVDPAPKNCISMETKENPMLSIVQDSPEQSIQPPVPMVFLNQLDTIESPGFLVDGIFPDKSYGQIFGYPGCFKSFVTLDICGHIASGTPWWGRHVKQGWVLYGCGEGFWGMKERVRSMLDYHHWSDQLPICFTKWLPNLTDPQTLTQMINWINDQSEKIKMQLRLMIIDTFSRGFFGNENSAEDVGKFHQAIDVLRNHTGCSVIQVHHTGHKQRERGRGSIANLGAFDFEYRIEKLIPDSPQFHFIHTKTKDFPPPDDMMFKTESVGNSLVVVGLNEEESKRYQYDLDKQTIMEWDGIKLTEQQQRGWELFLKIFAGHEHNADGHDNVDPMVAIADFIDDLDEHGIVKRKSARRRVVDQLVRKGLLARDGNYLKPAAAPSVRK